MEKTAEYIVSSRVKISGLWVSVLFIFAYVDIFALLRADFVQDVLAGTVAGFDADQTFLALTTLYIVIPSLMVFLTLVLPAKINRWANIVLASVYILTIAAGTVGETWIYYLFGSAVEVILLVAVVLYAWKSPT